MEAPARKCQNRTASNLREPSRTRALPVEIVHAAMQAGARQFKSEARVLVGDREDRAGGRQVRLLRWERCALLRSEPAWLRERAEEARPAYATHSTDRADQASRDGDRHQGLR